MTETPALSRQGVEHVVHQGTLLAIIVREGPLPPGITFLTDNAYSQQLALMRHPAGHPIDAHVHCPVAREVAITQEVLIVKSGRLRVDFYAGGEAEGYVGSTELAAGDLILLIAGGHGFRVLEELEMIEIKQGPYVGPADKRRFDGVAETGLRPLAAPTEA